MKMVLALVHLRWTFKGRRAVAKGSNGLLKEGLLIRNGPSLAFIRKVEYGEAEIAKHSEYSPKTCEKIILSEARNYFCPFLSSWIILVERGQVQCETTGNKYDAIPQPLQQ